MTSAQLEPVLIVPDAHIPYHDTRAWDLFLKVGKAFRPKHLITIGDLADFYGVSSHSKDPRRAFRLPEELKAVNGALDQLDALKAPHKVFIEGNHCDRLARYLQDKAPELFSVVDVPQLFKLEDRGWEFVPYKSDIKLGKLRLTHDVGKAGRFATHAALDTYQHSIVTGHTHRLCYVVEGNAVGEFKLAANFGWLGDASKVEYMHRVNVLKNWALGFGVGYLHPKTGIVYLTPVPIVNYTCVVNGQLFAN